MTRFSLCMAITLPVLAALPLGGDRTISLVGTGYPVGGERGAFHGQGEFPGPADLVTIYVDDDAPLGGNGVEWATAYRFLQDALADAEGVQEPREVEIRVAQGTYKPDQDEGGNVTPGDREATFQLLNGVALQGGYAGIGAPDPDVHDVDLYETTLSGDLLGDDGPDFENYDENSCHVVTAWQTDDTATLGGFTVSGGNASYPYDYGGGLLAELATCAIQSCRFNVNRAGVGGSAFVFNDGADLGPSFVDCSFTGSRAVSDSGGAIEILESSPTFTGCTFTANIAEKEGGAVRSRSGNPTVQDCLFDGNTGLGFFGGGALYITDGSISNCGFLGNTAPHGGAVSVMGGGDLVLTECSFQGNTASVLSGGALSWFFVNGNPVISGCTFTLNEAHVSGGALYLKESEFGPVAVEDCTFSGNIASATEYPIGGGAIYSDDVELTLQRCLFEGNETAGDGGGLVTGGATVVEDCTFEGNVAHASHGYPDGGGGAILNSDDLTMINCEIRANQTSLKGGGLSHWAGVADIQNCIFADNQALGEEAIGGGIYNDPQAMHYLTVTDCQFLYNHADLSGGGVNNDGGAIFWGSYFSGNTSSFGSDGITSTYLLRGSGVSGPDNLRNGGQIWPGFIDPPTSVFSTCGDFIQFDQPSYQGYVFSTLAIEIGGTEFGVDYSALAIPNGTGEFLGTVHVELINGFEPEIGDTFHIVTSLGVTRPFDLAYVPAISDADGEKFMHVAYDGGNIHINVEDWQEYLFEDPFDPELLGGAPSSAVLGDFDGDGADDLAVTIPADSPQDPGTLIVLLSEVDPDTGEWLGFNPVPLQPTLGQAPSGIDVGHFNNDDHLDMAITNAGSDDLLVFLGDGDGTFDGQAPIHIQGLSEPRDVAAADFDGDGLIDLAIANTGNDTVLVYTNDAGTGFNYYATIETDADPWVIDPEDVDNDSSGLSDLVIVCGGEDPGTVLIVLNDGGIFQEPIRIEVGSQPTAVAMADFDSNGHTDIVVTNWGDHTVSLILNDGGGQFRPMIELEVGGNPRSVTAVDLEPDSDVDIALIANVDGTPVVQILRNDQNGGEQFTLADAETIDIGGALLFVLSGDVDGDNDDDLVVIDEGAGGGEPLDPWSPRGSGEGEVNVLLNRFCPADLSGNGVVDIDDVFEVLSHWGPCDDPNNCPEDLDDSGEVDIDDLFAVLAAWGPC